MYVRNGACTRTYTHLATVSSKYTRQCGTDSCKERCSLNGAQDAHDKRILDPFSLDKEEESMNAVVDFEDREDISEPANAMGGNKIWNICN